MPPAVAPAAARERLRCAPRGVGSSPRIGETPRARLGVRATPDTGRGRVSSRVLRTSRRSPFSNGISRARSRPVPGVRAPRVSRPPGRSRRSHRYDDDRRGRDRGRGRGGRPRARRQLVLPLPRERHGGRDPTLEDVARWASGDFDAVEDDDELYKMRLPGASLDDEDDDVDVGSWFFGEDVGLAIEDGPVDAVGALDRRGTPPPHGPPTTTSRPSRPSPTSIA